MLSCPSALQGSLALWLAALATIPLLSFVLLSQFLPATPSKEPHTKELHFPASSCSHACHEFVGAQLVTWGMKAALCWRGMPVLELPTGLHSCRAPRQVLLSPSDSSEELSQLLHDLYSTH